MTTEQTKATLPDGQHFQLTRNAGGHHAGETFTRKQAEASGIDAGNFQPFADDKRTKKAAAPQAAPAGTDSGKATKKV